MFRPQFFAIFRVIIGLCGFNIDLTDCLHEQLKLTLNCFLNISLFIHNRNAKSWKINFGISSFEQRAITAVRTRHIMSAATWDDFVLWQLQF
jgi:hypothetical protein